MADENLLHCIVNNRTVATDANPNMVVLDFLRGEEHLTGTKEGCREGDCGACTILVGELINGHVVYKSVNSCLMPLGDAEGKHLLSVEGINQPSELNPIQKAFVDEGGTQCGFCTPGFLMSLTGYCMNSQHHSLNDAVNAMDGNICRCTGHPPIKKAAATIIENLSSHSAHNTKTRQQSLIDQKILPDYLSTIAERLQLLQQEGGILSDVEEHTHIVSGGTDLYVQRAFTMVNERTKRIAHKKKHPVIWEEENTIHCLGVTTIEEFQRSELIRSFIPNIEKYAFLFGSTPIRNRATLAGNIVNASPIGDMTSLLLALDASLLLRDGNSQRIVLLRKFYKGYKQTDKTKNEIVEAVILPKPSRPRLINFEKVSRRRYLDIASVNSAIVVSMDGMKIVEAHLTAGGVFATPLFLRETSEYLTGKSITSDVIAEAITKIQQEIKPISDARGSADYKRLLARQLFIAHLVSLFPDITLPKELSLS